MHSLPGRWDQCSYQRTQLLPRSRYDVIREMPTRPPEDYISTVELSLLLIQLRKRPPVAHLLRTTATYWSGRNLQAEY